MHSRWLPEAAQRTPKSNVPTVHARYRLQRLKGTEMRIALFEPEIAGNVGAVLRLGACLGAAVDLIEPMGFQWDDRRVRRTAMDYIDHVAVTRHASFDAFWTTVGAQRLVLFTTKASEDAYAFRFEPEDVL